MIHWLIKLLDQNQKEILTISMSQEQVDFNRVHKIAKQEIQNQPDTKYFNVNMTENGINQGLYYSESL